MTRARTAVVLAVVAALTVVATVVVALVVRDPQTETFGDLPRDAGLRVTDPASGASFEVPAQDWQVRGRRARIYYADSQGRPAAVVRGPAVFHSGYCGASPRGSYRAFAGFTRQPFEAWAGAIGDVVSRSAEGGVRRATLRPTESGACGAPEVELAMATRGDVRLVLVADAGALHVAVADDLLASLELAEPDVAD